MYGPIDNINNTLLDDLLCELQPGGVVSIAGERFSIYAYEKLKEKLEALKEFRFIFTSPTFTTDRENKERREFYIPRLDRERSLYNCDFELKLRNELTQRAIAKECAEWIQRKANFRSNVTSYSIPGFMTVDDKVYSPIQGFTTVDLGCERGKAMFCLINKVGTPNSDAYLKNFEAMWNDCSRMQDVKREVIENIATAYKENAPEFVYFVALYNIFNEFLEDVSEDVLPNEKTGFKDSIVWKSLYNFQRDAALAIINKLEKYNGCILADSVGLGKTYTALAVIKYYENRNRNVLVLCPKKLQQNWLSIKSNYVGNSLYNDRFRYDVLYHTDLTRETGFSNEIDLSRLNWGNYDLVVIDESHNFRNGGAIIGEEGDKRENRYGRLLNRIIRSGVQTKVLMLSATPVNNRFVDLKNQLALAYEGDKSELFDQKLNLGRPIDEIFRSAQRAFNEWNKLPVGERTTKNLLDRLNFDFFELLDAVTIARSRKHIEKYYDSSSFGSFPTRLLPKSYSPPLTDLKNAIEYNQIFERLLSLNLAIYTPSKYILASKRAKYVEIFKDEEINKNFTQESREQGIRRIMAISLLKRLESSVYSFRLTLERVLTALKKNIDKIDEYERSRRSQSSESFSTFPAVFDDDLDEDDESAAEFIIGDKTPIALDDMDAVDWRNALAFDRDTIEELLKFISVISSERDSKLQQLFQIIDEKIASPINPGNKKLLIFTAFADTAEYLYERVSRRVFEKHGLYAALVSGTVDGKTTAPLAHKDMNSILSAFAPIARKRSTTEAKNEPEIDVLIATDCISEGQNLQDCDYLVNYDIHWNPVRIVQRFGRVDRIGSPNSKIQLVNFWPDVSLDEYIALRSKVEDRMKIVNLAATGDDNIIAQEKIELEYRKKQLKRLQEEVLDLDDASSGVSIVDLGLNEFRMDLLEYMKERPDVKQTPFGLHAIASAREDAPKGIVFILKNRTESVNVEKKNRLHPFYLVYMDADGEVFVDCSSPKETLDKLRVLCRGKSAPDPALYKPFNKETDDGRKMRKYSAALTKAIESIVERKKHEAVGSLFRPGGTVSSSNFRGLDDFELLCFLVVR